MCLCMHHVVRDMEHMDFLGTVYRSFLDLDSMCAHTSLVPRPACVFQCCMLKNREGLVDLVM